MSRSAKVEQYISLNKKSYEVGEELAALFQKVCDFECYVTFDRVDGAMLGDYDYFRIAPIHHFKGMKTITQEFHHSKCI